MSRWMILRLFSLACLFAFSVSGLAQTGSRCPKPVAEFLEAKGTVELKTASGIVFRAETKTPICPGDTIDVWPRSQAAIIIHDTEQKLRVDQQTTLRISEPPTGGKLIDLIKGAIYASWKRLIRTALGEVPGLDLRTPFVNGKVTGTEFFVRVEQDRTLVTVFEGRLQLTNNQGSLNVTSNQSAVTMKGQAPQIRIVVRPRDAVQWTMYYQPVLSPLLEPSLAKTPAAQALRKSLEEFRLGDITEAFTRLDQVPDADRDEHYYVYRASLLLGVGRSNEAQEDLDHALEISPENSEAYAIKTVIAIAQNDRTQALSDGHKAVELSPRSAAAKIALSYGLQANLQLEEARDVLLQAVEDQADNGLAWARLSEIWLSLGYLDRALECAQEAISASPDLSSAHTVLGFARLAQIKVDEAKAAFEKAIALEPGDPLARLGLGLAKIRDGHLDEGRSEIEIAAALDPNDSLIRSYLGKAYFEEKRDALADEQFNLAKALDPLDPTPYFYDAIRKQTINRPVEALRDLQKSIELNDNRAVYRSRLLMDQDLAARSASLGRIYRDLGFEQLALVQGWNSLRFDPGNYSAHRFLADSYSSLPRHEIARVSELLQSQLRQPLNITPLQPQLNENNILLLSGTGPSDAAFNEFNPLFTRNRLALQANGILGNNGTLGDDLVVSGIYGKMSFSAGQYHYDTDGFRENNDSDQNIYNAFFQASLTHKTRIQGEFRSMDKRYGDPEVRFDPDNFDANLRNVESHDTARIGFYHAFSPKSDIIASVIGQRADFKGTTSSPIFGDITLYNNIGGFIAEAQHLYRSEHYSILSGMGHFNADEEWEQDLPFGIQINGESNLHQTNGYVYSQISYLKNVTLTVGFSVDAFKDVNIEHTQVNPKIGLTWKALPSTLVRLAGFRALKRNLVADQTIEPTQVAGFNQFYDDELGTDTRRFGIAIDHRFTPNLYAGAEISKRILRFSREAALPSPSQIKFDWNERLGRIYLYWMPHSWLAATAGYRHERFERPSPVGVIEFNASTRLKTYRMPLNLSLHHPNGIFAQIGTTYVDQWREFVDPFAGIAEEQDCFWILDGAIGYRFPQRYGLITLGIKNLLDESFFFQDTDVRNPTLIPERLVFLRLALSF